MIERGGSDREHSGTTGPEREVPYVTYAIRWPKAFGMRYRDGQ